MDSSVSIIACFEALCGVRPVTELQKLIPSICNIEDAKFIDNDCDWSSAKHRAQWWAKCDHLKMLSKAFSTMEEDIWKQCPSSTNGVECRNKECKSDTPQCLKLAMIKVYKVDKVACLKHIAAEKGSVLSYRSRTEEARRMEALAKQKQRMKCIPDKTSQYGPPDRVDNFKSSLPHSSRKRKYEETHTEIAPKRRALCVDNNMMEYIPNSHPENCWQMRKDEI